MEREYRFFVYIMTNWAGNVLYTGLTNNLLRRVKDHAEKRFPGFSAKYNTDKLVYYEEFDHIESAILRENKIKAGSRRKKLDLIRSKNSDWRDLCPNGERLLPL